MGAGTERRERATVPMERDPAALSALLARVDVGLMVVDAERRVRYANPPVAALLGVEREQLVGRAAADVLESVRPALSDPQGLVAKWRGAVEQALAGRTERKQRGKTMIDGAAMSSFDFELKSPEERRLRAKVFPVALPGEQETFVGVELRDVTTDDAADREHRQLVSVVSHELKQPVTVIHGSAVLMTQPGTPADAVLAYARAIHEQSARLNDLLNDLLDLQRMGAGALRCEIEAIDLRQVIHEALRSFATAPTGHAFHVEVAEELPAVRGDGGRLRQVLSNLLSNAVKYSRAGNRIWIAAAREGKMVRVSVSDEGIGIPKAALPRVFAPFYRTPAAERAPGHGLGLAIAKSIVDLHGGQIDVCSKPGKGSTFFFTVPVASPAS